MFRRKSKTNPVGSHPSRRAERHATDGFSCELGDVRDLSVSGMRVHANNRPSVSVGDVRPLKLKTPRGSLSVKAQIVRIQRKGMRSFDLGIRFLELNRGTQQVLDALGRFGFVGPGSIPAGDAAGMGASAAPPPPGSASTNGQNPRRKRPPDLPDYYLILGVGPKATENQIRGAFRTMAWRYHPDVSDDPEGQAKFSLIHEAYKILRDPDERQLYDRKRAG